MNDTDVTAQRRRDDNERAGAHSLSRCKIRDDLDAQACLDAASAADLSPGVVLCVREEFDQEDRWFSRPRSPFAEGSPDALSQGLGDPKIRELLVGHRRGGRTGGRKPREKSAPNQPTGGRSRGLPPPTP